jgi:hypothetical protein
VHLIICKLKNKRKKQKEVEQQANGTERVELFMA